MISFRIISNEIYGSPATTIVTFFKKISIMGGGIQLGPLGTTTTNRPIVPAPGDYDDGEIGGIIGKGNRSTMRKPASMPLCPPQIPHACQDVNPGRRGGKPATKRLSYGTAYNSYFLSKVAPFSYSYLFNFRWTGVP
jgi:hypothetical protein